MTELIDQLRCDLIGADSRERKAARAAGTIRRLGGFRWVGIYNVTATMIEVMAWEGPGAPTYPSFPLTQGLNGAAVASAEPVVVHDVSRDQRYLRTIGGTKAEMIVPIKDPNRKVVGTIDIESDRVNAFSEADVSRIEKCAAILRILWG